LCCDLPDRGALPFSVARAAWFLLTTKRDEARDELARLGVPLELPLLRRMLDRGELDDSRNPRLPHSQKSKRAAERKVGGCSVQLTPTRQQAGMGGVTDASSGSLNAAEPEPDFNGGVGLDRHLGAKLTTSHAVTLHTL
jgi:hypothetical protein